MPDADRFVQQGERGEDAEDRDQVAEDGRPARPDLRNTVNIEQVSDNCGKQGEVEYSKPGIDVPRIIPGCFNK